MMVKNKEPKVVVLGGGTGMPVLLKGIKNYPIRLSTVVTVADDGGSTGKIRQEIDIPAPGDIRNVIVALSRADEELNGLFQHRFDEGETLSGHAVGNIVLAAMKRLTGDFYKAVEEVSAMFKVKGDIYPIVNESVVLHAEMTDGTIVSGESNIPHDHKIIKRIFLTPENIEPNPKVVQAINEADLVIISPGSLYTSILPNLILGGVIKALHQTSAKIAYVCNVMTQHGETVGYSASDHVKAIDSHIGKGVLDTIILHDDQINPDILKLYEEEHAAPVTFDEAALRQLGIEVMQADIVDYSEKMIRHNTKRITDILYKMACEASNK